MLHPLQDLAQELNTRLNCLLALLMPYFGKERWRDLIPFNEVSITHQCHLCIAWGKCPRASTGAPAARVWYELYPPPLSGVPLVVHPTYSLTHSWVCHNFLHSLKDRKSNVKSSIQHKYLQNPMRVSIQQRKWNENNYSHFSVLMIYLYL